MLNPRSASRFTLVVAGLAVLLSWLLPAPAAAQKKKPKKDEAAAPADADAADAAATPTEPTPEQIEATRIFQEGKTLATEKKYEEAIAKFVEAYDIYADPGLLYVTGEAYQLWGNDLSNTDREAGFEKYRLAVESYEKFLEASPESPIAATVSERVAQLSEALEAEEARKQKEEEERIAAEEAEKEAARKAEEERLRKLEASQGMQIVLDAIALGGVDQDLSGSLRFLLGGLLNWGHFAVEGHIGLDGFIRVDGDKGISGRSFTLLDLGVRYGLEDHFEGFFVSGGGSFGLFTGKPHDRAREGDVETCGSVNADGDCSFDIDKNIVTRLAIGYGFEASESATVAVRLEGQLWHLSVDGDQPTGAPPAALVEKPQRSMAVLLGLEFMLWK